MRLKLKAASVAAVFVAGLTALAASPAHAANAAAQSETRTVTTGVWRMNPSRIHPDGRGTAKGDCGTATLVTQASLHRFELQLFSSGVTMGSGSYTFNTNGVASVPVAGGVNGRGSTVFLSGWQNVPVPGIAPGGGFLTGFVLTSGGPCGWTVSAPWNN